MRTTMVVDDELIRRASDLSGVTEKTALVRWGLQALIARLSGQRLAQLGGSESALRKVPRRRTGLRSGTR